MMRMNVLALSVVVLLMNSSLRAEDHAAPAFPKGTLSFQTYGTYSGGLGEFTNTASAAAGAGYYVFDNLSLSLEASGYRAQNAPGRDAWMYGVSGVLRHHLVQFDRTTFFIDAAFGPAQATSRTPAGGTYFNFVTRTGLGATYQLKDHTYLIGGARYFHISNARIEGPIRNPSINGVEGFLGVMWTF